MSGETPPDLSAADLKAALAEAYRTRRHHHLFAFYGRAEDQTLVVDGGDVQVVRVQSELELREKLPPLAADDDVRIAFLVPWAYDIPLDLAGRFALNGRVLRIGKDARLKALFGVSEIDEEARRSPLCDYLLRAGRTYTVSAGRLTADALWSLWLETDWGLELQGGLGLDTLLAFAASDPRGARFVEAMAEPAAGKTREALLAWLGRTLGPAAPALWRAWESGRGRRALELGLAIEPLAGSALAGVRMWVKTKVREVLAIESEAEVLPVAEALAREVSGALRLLGRRLTTQEQRGLARAADDLVVDPEVRAALLDSPRLPSAWTQRLERLGEALAAPPSAAAVGTAVRALRSLEGHVFFKDEDQRHVLKRAEMAVRAMAWLVARPDRRIEPGNTAHGDVEALGRWYALEGGYVDRARHAARGSEQDAFGRGVQAVVAAADLARTELDRRFARALVAWYDAGQPSTQVVPIHDAVKRIAVRFLEGEPERRLLVLLLDGMAWAQASELLESLGSRAAPWGPLAWHVARDTRIGEGPLPVVLAAAPTVTEVSRSSFFAGKPFGPGAKLTTPDPDHWARHVDVRKLVPATDVPRLLLRGEGHTKAGGASPEALSLVADPERRVVALVLNAIDDSLKASHAVRHSWSVDTIASLPDLLEKAREHGRAVLLASDHGHIPPDRIIRSAAASAGGGARWRPWPSADAPVHENEIGLAGSRVYTPPGAHGVVLLADDAAAYTGSVHAGEHGGATLAEVVAPCVLIGCADAVHDDAGQQVHPAQVPQWWHFDVDEPVVVAETPRPSRKKRVDAQVELIPVAPPPPALPPSPLAGSAVLKARAPAAALRQEVVDAVDVLLARQGVMTGEAFASAVRVLPFRVGGFISKLQEVLNLDGYEVIRYDPAARQVHLDRAKLAQLFEVTL